MSARNWKSLHHQHSAKRTRAIQDRALFSDVEVHVKGVVFHCHRYVLAQSSDLFFSEFTGNGRTETSSDLGAGGEIVPFETGKLKPVFGNVLLKAEDCEARGAGRAAIEADAHKHRQEILLEELGKPAEKRTGSSGSVAGDLKTAASTKSCNGAYEAALKLLKDASNSCSSSQVPVSAADFSVQKRSTPFPRETELGGRKPIVRLDVLSAEDFRAILDAVYNGHDPVTEANAFRLYKAAVQLQISSLVEHCERVILDLLRERTVDAAQILHDPQMANNSRIEHAALDALLTDFGPDTCTTAWFLSLPAEKLFSVLNDQRLNVRHEDEVYRALLSWYQHDPSFRERHIAKALSQIRLANLSQRTLVEELLLHPLCSGQGGKGRRGSQEGVGDGNDVRLLELVQRALAYYLLPDRRHDEALRCAQFRPSQVTFCAPPPPPHLLL